MLEKGELRGAPLVRFVLISCFCSWLKSDNFQVLVINVMSSRRAEQVLSAGLDSRMLIGPGDARGN